MNGQLLKLESVTVTFGGVVALSEVTFSLESSELLGLIGPNGAGKTTALRSITGVVTPQHGTVTVAGHDLSGLSIQARARLGLGFSQQLVRPFFNLSLLDNVALAAGHAITRSPRRALFARDRSRQRAQALELLERVGIADAAASAPAELPLGYLKRLEVARALALSPRLLLLDEPLAGLNQQEARRLADTLRELNGDGLSMLLIEHNLSEVMRICARLVVLDNGRKIAEGVPGEVMSRADVRRAYLGESYAQA